ncbi:hypothetical protein ABEY43_07310 [Priestia megaterium]
MRTPSECEEMLEVCRQRVEYWHKEMKKYEAKIVDRNNIPWEFDRAERQMRHWKERVKTLEYVLGLSNVI